jgi:hypothetical protein
MLLSEFQKRDLGLRFESLEIFHVAPQQLNNVGSGAIAQTNPHDLRRCPTEDAQTMKILVLGHQYTTMLSSQSPDDRVRRTALAQYTNVQRVGKQIVQSRHKFFGQLFVEEQTHDSGGRGTHSAALTLGGIGQARSDVFSGELREVGQDLVF